MAEQLLSSDHLNLLTNLASVIVAFGGLYLVYYKEVIERKIKRDALVKILNGNPSVLAYRKELYKKLVPEKWRNNHQILRFLFFTTGFIIPIIISIVYLRTLNFLEILLSSFYFTLVIFIMFYLIIIFLGVLIDKFHLVLSDILRSVSGGLFLIFAISLLTIGQIANNLRDYQFFILFLSVAILEALFLYFLQQKEFNTLKSCSMNCGKEEKEFLPVIKILLDNGIEKKGKLIEFFDSDVIEIENEGQREFILWNKIDGISFPTEGKEGN
jgi:hypothetical protein